MRPRGRGVLLSHQETVRDDLGELRIPQGPERSMHGVVERADLGSLPAEGQNRDYSRRQQPKHAVRVRLLDLHQRGPRGLSVHRDRHWKVCDHVRISRREDERGCAGLPGGQR